jgi:hypothetical protein
MEHKAYVLKVDGTREDLDHQPTLTEAQKAVGGYIEPLPCKVKGTIVYGNEDGRPTGLPVNQQASRLLGYPVVGDVMVLEGWRTTR